MRPLFDNALKAEPNPMIANEPRDAARRRNAPHSIRPSQDGDDSPRSAALVDGLCASVIVAEDAKLVQKRSREYFQTLRPQNHFHCWIVTQVALISIRIDRDERIERRVRDKIAIKAEVLWESDRKLEAIRLGTKLGLQPEEVVELLQRTPQGCEWLMGRWAMLAHSADVQEGQWTPQQTELAFDLLGTPSLFRQGQKPGAALDIQGRVIVGSDDPASVARREIAELEGRRDLVEGLDRANRSLAEADLGDDADAELKRLRRHEAMLHSRLRWCMKQLRFQSPEKEPYRGLWANWVDDQEDAPRIQEAPPLPEPEPEVTPGVRFPNLHPPFDLEPEEFPADGEEVDIPKIVANRRSKKLQKAEARRDARRREVEKLRA
jgi:hypothetical protein